MHDQSEFLSFRKPVLSSGIVGTFGKFFFASLAISSPCTGTCTTPALIASRTPTQIQEFFNINKDATWEEGVELMRQNAVRSVWYIELIVAS